MKNIIIIILLVVLVGGGILAYQNWWLPKQEVGEGESYIKVISPNGGAAWETGKTYEIQWEAKNPDKAPYEICLIKLPQPAAPYVCFYTIVDDYLGDERSYLWQIPDIAEIMGGGEYLIRIIVKGESKLSWFSDESNPFTVVVSSSEIAGWKMYRNEKAGLEIKYPPKDWGIISESDNYVLIGIVPYEIPHSGFTVNISNQILDDYISSYEDMADCKLGSPPEVESIKITGEFMLGGINATKLEACSDHSGTNIDIIFARKNSKSYIIQPIPGDTIHDQILSTFRFLE